MNKYLTLRNQAKTEQEEVSLTEMAFSMEFSKFAELENTWLALFIITVVVFLVCLIVVIFLRKRISIAIALIGQASKWVDRLLLFFFTH